VRGTGVRLGPVRTDLEGEEARSRRFGQAAVAGRRRCRVNQGRKELIDHILVSAALVKPLEAIGVEPIIDQPLPSIGQDPNARRNAPSSDHAPVVASFADF